MSISLRDSDICNQTDVVNIILFTHTADKPTHRHNYTQKTPDIYTHTQTHMYTHRYNIVYITHQKYSIYMYIVYIIHVHVSLDT